MAERGERGTGLVRPLAALLAFAVSFGYAEAAVVVYVRGLYEPLHRRLYPAAPADALYPLVSPGQLAAAGPDYPRWLRTELAREGATLAMLAAVALAVAGTGRAWLAAFLAAF